MREKCCWKKFENLALQNRESPKQCKKNHKKCEWVFTSRDDTYALEDTVRAGNPVVVPHAVEGLRDEALQDLMDQEQDVLRAWAMNLHQQLPLAARVKQEVNFNSISGH